jgi:hypothetical protein
LSDDAAVRTGVGCNGDDNNNVLHGASRVWIDPTESNLDEGHFSCKDAPGY